MWPLLRFIFVNLLAAQIKGDAFCSVEELKVAAEVDRLIAGEITRWNQHFELSPILLGLMKSYLQEHERMRRDDLTNIVSNPVHSFQIIRRIVLSVPEIQAQLPKSFEGQSFVDDLDTFRQQTNLTLTDDLHGAAIGLVRLQVAQQLFACDLAEGKISTFQTSARLSLHDCIFIANVALDSNEFDTAAEWAECAQNLAGDLKDPLAERTIALLLESFTISHDESPHNNTNNTKNSEGEEGAKKAETDAESSSRRFPLSIRGSNKTARQHREMVFNEINNMEFDRNIWWLQDNFQYEAALCRGKRFLTAKEESNLVCITEGLFHPYFYLQPAKLEFQSFDPEVVNIHDFLRDSDIELLKTNARSLLVRSVVGGIGGDSSISSQRVSKTAWIDDDIDERIERISRRIGLLLNMNTNMYVGDAEPFQVVNYGIGGQYYQHHDFLVIQETKDDIYIDPQSYGDRIATFLIYLSDVALGGATAFLSAGVAVKPVKGSATFWYNLYSNGDGNTKTFHAGCPVVYGSKWIANKWFREKGQMFNKPCDINGSRPKTPNSEE